MEHSKIGASSADRWINCPGSVALIDSLPVRQKEGSIYAATGTLCHSIAEDALKNNKFLSHFLSILDTTQIVDGYEVEVTQDLLDGVFYYVNFVREELSKSNYGTLLVEHSFHLKDIDENAYGTNDACILEEFGKLTVIDLKTGYKKVSAENNKQLLYYALGANQLGDFNEIEIIIVQPFAEDEEDRISRCTINPMIDLENYRTLLRNAIANTKKPSAEIKKGTWCKYCAASLICPDNRQVLVDMGLESLNEFKPNSKLGYTAEQLSEILDNLPTVKQWIKDIEALALSEAQRGIKLKNYKLVKSWGNRTWAEGAEEEALKKFKKDVIYDQKLKTPPQLEKLIGKEFVNKWAFKPDRGIKLVHVTEKGEALEGGNTIEIAKSEFDDVDDFIN